MSGRKISRTESELEELEESGSGYNREIEKLYFPDGENAISEGIILKFVFVMLELFFASLIYFL
jgi:hypothetical protein